MQSSRCTNVAVQRWVTADEIDNVISTLLQRRKKKHFVFNPFSLAIQRFKGDFRRQFEHLTGSFARAGTYL